MLPIVIPQKLLHPFNRHSIKQAQKPQLDGRKPKKTKKSPPETQLI
jgi:hypothetical protein